MYGVLDWRSAASHENEVFLKFQYVNPKSVEEFIGKYAPVSAFMLARIIEEALDNVNQGYVQTTAKRRLKSDPPEISKALVGVVDKMLANNLQRGKRPAWEMYDGLDFDLVHEISSVRLKGEQIQLVSVKRHFFDLQIGPQGA